MTPAAPPHLVELGLAWPPDTFLRRKLVGLARRGFRITVVAPYGERVPVEPADGVEVVWMPSAHEPLAVAVLLAVRDCARLRVRDPARLAAVRTAWRRLRYRPRRERLRWLRQLAALAPLDPDVVQFEWESAAIGLLPLLDLWACPMVMSCHGGLDRYARSPSHFRAVSGVAAAFHRAAAVHCVSDAIRAEALRHGLDPVKARVIRPGVDPAAFAPAPR